jgi:ketosteroid isomerase-like protein
MKNVILPLLAVLFLGSCKEVKEEKTVEKTFDLAPVKAAIAASNATYGDAFVKNDASLLVAKYTKDGCIMPAGAPKLCGAEGIGGFFGVAQKGMGVKNVKLTTDEVMGGADAVVETGTYELFGEGNKSIDNGKFVVAWKQEDGKWKMHRDMFTSSVAPPAPKK